MRRFRGSLIVLLSVALSYTVGVESAGAAASASTLASIRSSAAIASNGSRTRGVSVFFIKDEHLKRVRVQVAAPALAKGAVQALLAGPTRAGLASEIPKASRLRSVNIGSDGVARVDLTSAFGSGGGSFSMIGRVAQLVYTLTALKNVHAVQILIEGERRAALGGEGVLIYRPLRRSWPGFRPYAPLNRTVSVFFMQGEHLKRVRARVSGPPALGAMEALLAGPRRAHLLPAYGRLLQGATNRPPLSTGIPAMTMLLDVRVGANGVAKVNLTRAFGSGGGTLSLMARFGEVIYTLTQLKRVHAVQILIEGNNKAEIGGEIVLTGQPLKRGGRYVAPLNRTVSVFFTRKGHLARGRARVVGPAPTGAMEALLAGPQRAILLGSPNRSLLGSQIPPDTYLIGVRVGSHGVAKVDLTERFGSGGGSLSMRLRVAQIVYTLTALKHIHAVRFKINHKRIVALGGEGLLLDKPIHRARFRDLAPGRIR